MKALLIFLLIPLLVSCGGTSSSKDEPTKMDLSGEWNTNIGPCKLPGTTDQSQLGTPTTDTLCTANLTRLYAFEGVVEYEKEIEIGAEMAGKPLQLVMERTKPSSLWVDGDSVGSCNSLIGPHIYNVLPLNAGSHTLKIRIDNSPTAVPPEVHSSHAWSEAVQTNWNGILGEFYIKALPEVYFSQVNIYPHPEETLVSLYLTIESNKETMGKVVFFAKSFNSESVHRTSTQEQEITLKEGENHLSLQLNMGDEQQLWSEFHPSLYKLMVNFYGESDTTSVEETFGIREISTEGHALLVNGLPTFLRGKHDAGVFPLTGYPPTDLDSWLEYLKEVKSYGFNHVRCHSYTPPQAALEAADLVGIYFQLELPLWGPLEESNQRLTSFLYQEAETILKHYGNHPSFVMMGLGNELWGERELMSKWVSKLKEQDSRHLYVCGANNNLGWEGPQDNEDLFIACRVGGGDGYTTHVRTSFAYVDADKGGILNNTHPNTIGTYEKAVNKSSIPVVSHETGQFQIYPDFGEIERYKGTLYPYNLKVFQRRAAERGLDRLASELHQASASWALECYKAEIEQALRTPNLSGFQLLDLQDYPGQGTALVGLLNAWMDPKAGISAEIVGSFCGPLVPMAMFPKYCFKASDTFWADIVVANYMQDMLYEPVKWQIGKPGEVPISEGSVETDRPIWELTSIGRIEVPLHFVTQNTQLELQISIDGHTNSYPIWVYVDPKKRLNNTDYETELGYSLRQRLERGESVLLMPNHDALYFCTVGGLFTPDFWNYSMFKEISESAGKEVSPGTLGLLIDDKHPLFGNFPTSNHTSWQWWKICRSSRPLIINQLEGDYDPIVRVIDNVERAHNLGLLMEFRVGNGKLLISMCDLRKVAHLPEGAAFIDAIVSYLESKKFNPTYEISFDELTELFSSQWDEAIEGVENASDYSR